MYVVIQYINQSFPPSGEVRLAIMTKLDVECAYAAGTFVCCCVV